MSETSTQTDRGTGAKTNKRGGKHVCLGWQGQSLALQAQQEVFLALAAGGLGPMPGHLCEVAAQLRSTLLRPCTSSQGTAVGSAASRVQHELNGWVVVWVDCCMHVASPSTGRHDSRLAAPLPACGPLTCPLQQLHDQAAPGLEHPSAEGRQLSQICWRHWLCPLPAGGYLPGGASKLERLEGINAVPQSEVAPASK